MLQTYCYRSNREGDFIYFIFINILSCMNLQLSIAFFLLNNSILNFIYHRKQIGKKKKHVITIFIVIIFYSEHKLYLQNINYLHKFEICILKIILFKRALLQRLSQKYLDGI